MANKNLPKSLLCTPVFFQYLWETAQNLSKIVNTERVRNNAINQ